MSRALVLANRNGMKCACVSASQSVSRLSSSPAACIERTGAPRISLFQPVPTAQTPTRFKSAMMLFRLDTEAVIINEVVINEIRLHECLWNPRNVYYKNKTEKYKAWEEVSVAVLPKYTTYSEDNKRRTVRAVQSRTELCSRETARDAYMKCRLIEIKKPTYKARQHRFIYNKLRFLDRARDVFEDIDEDVNNRFKAPTHSAGGNTAGITGLAAGQATVRPAFVTKEPPNKGVPLGKIRQSVPPSLCVSITAPTHSASGNATDTAAGQAAVRPACHTKELPNKAVPFGKSGMCVIFKDEEGSNSFVGDNSESQSIAFKGPTHNTGGNAAGTADVQDAVHPACHTKEPPNKAVPFGKSGMCVVFKDNEEGLNSFVGDNSENQSTSTVCDDDMSEGSDEIMNFAIDIHDDFKENIKHLVTTFDGIDDKAVNDNIQQECLPGISSQNNYQKDPLATAEVTRPPKNSTSAKTSVFESDDLLFFNSLAPLIDNFGIHQKLMLRSKIMEVVNEVGKIGPVKVKQERET